VDFGMATLRVKSPEALALVLPAATESSVSITFSLEPNPEPASVTLDVGGPTLGETARDAAIAWLTRLMEHASNSIKVRRTKHGTMLHLPKPR
jgi:hypothetical protein